jgi:hypothetical protein
MNNYSGCETIIDLSSKNAGQHLQGKKIMATFRDPINCFAPLEIIERLLEIRLELGYEEILYVHKSVDLVEFLDAYGFDVYAFSSKNEKINYGDYRASIVPGGDNVHCSLTAH